MRQENCSLRWTRTRSALSSAGTGTQNPCESVSIAELMIKVSIGKMTVPFNPVETAQETGFELLDYRAEGARLLQYLPLYHRDLFDRRIITYECALTHAITYLAPSPSRYESHQTGLSFHRGSQGPVLQESIYRVIRQSTIRFGQVFQYKRI